MRATLRSSFTDDGSNSDVFASLRDTLDHFRFPSKYLWQQDRRFRASEARNNAIRLARGKVLLFLDGDLIPAVDCARKHVESHDGSLRVVGGNRKWRGEVLPEHHSLPILELISCLESEDDVDALSLKRERMERQRRTEWLSSEHPWRACFSGNVSVTASQLVYFDERFVGWGAEDWEFNYRLAVLNGYLPSYRDDITTYHLETPAAVSNVFRTGSHDEIVCYMQNMFRLRDHIHSVGEQDLFFGLSRLRLNPVTNVWSVVPRAAGDDNDIYRKVVEAETWLHSNGLYPTS